MIDWDEATKEVADLCGIYRDRNENFYRSGIMDDLEVITHEKLKKGLRELFGDKK